MRIFVTQEASEAVFTLEHSFTDGRRWDQYKECLDGAQVGQTRSFAPVSRALTICKRLKAAGFKLDLSPAIVASLEALVCADLKEEQDAKERLALVHKGLSEMGLELFPYQAEGVEWLAQKRAALLSDEPGLGKTIQALTALPYRSPTLVVSPAVAKGVWRREAQKWRPDLEPQILSGKDSFRWPGPGEIVVTSYNLLPGITEQNLRDHRFPSLPPGVPKNLSVVFDEAHYLKTPDSQRTRAALAFAEQAFASQGRVWLLTGTPLLNEPPELYTLLSVAGLAVEAFGRYSTFFELFHGKRIPMGKLGVEKTVWGKPDDSVPERLARVMLRRMKRDVLPQLPEKIIEVLEVGVDADYMRELDKIAFSLTTEDGVSISDPMAIFEATRTSRVAFERVAQLRKLVALAKIPAALAFADEMEEQGEKLVVMSAHLEPLKAFAKRKGWGVIQGSTPAHERTALEDRFQRGELSGLACSIKAAGVALTLTAAARMLFVDESWTPSENVQAEDRIVRLGQRRGVIVTRLFCDHELDKHVLRVLHRKEVLISRVVDAAARRGA